MIFKNSAGDVITELNFSVQRGSQSPVQAVTIQNPFSVDKNITLYGIESPTNPCGRAIDTYESQFFSLDNQSFVSSLPVTVPGGGSLVVYTKYSPPDQAVPGECEWTFHHEPHEDYSGGPLGLTEHATILITGSTDGILPNFTVRITIPYQSFMRSDFGDMRFVDDDGSTILSYNRVSYTASTSAIFDVKIPSLPASPNIYNLNIYSGNSEVTDASDLANSYLIGDLFSTSQNSDSWINLGGASHSTANGQMTCQGSTEGLVVHPTQLPNDIIFEFDVVSASTDYWGSCVIANDKTNVPKGYLIDIGSGSINSSIFYGNGTSWSSLSQGSPVAINHVKIVRKGNTLTLYVNDVSITSTTDSNLISGGYIGFRQVVNRNKVVKNVKVTRTTTNPPSIGTLSSWVTAVKDYDVEVKAGIQYAAAEIEGLDYNPSFGVWIGDQYYE